MIPKLLRECDQWVLWREVEREGRPTKLPFNARRPQQTASTTNPRTWSSYAEARAALQSAEADGIGFVFTADDPFVAIDLDGVRDRKTGELTPWAASLVEHLDSYTEVSPSGNGLHVIVRGSLPADAQKKAGAQKKNQIEVYDQGRYFTITGNTVTATGVRSRQRQLDDLVFVMKLWGRKDVRQLWIGESLTGDASNDDFHLARAIIDAGERDPDEIGRLMHLSGLARNKWDTRRGEGTYLSYTVSKALGANTSAEPDALEIKWASDFRPKPVDWFWELWLPRGFLGVLGGHPGLGKSQIALGLVAAMTTGRRMPDGVTMPLADDEFVMVLSEDPIEQVVIPRLLANGADMRKIAVKAQVVGDKKLFNFKEHESSLRDAVRQTGKKLAFLVLDPMTLFLGRGNWRGYSEAYESLSGLTAFADEMNCTILGVVHLNKKSELTAMQRIMDSTAFSGAPRFLLMTAYDKDEEMSVFWVEKDNLGPKPEMRLQYRLESRTVSDHELLENGDRVSIGPPIKTSRIRWQGTTEIDGGDILQSEAQSATKLTKRILEQTIGTVSETPGGDAWLTLVGLAELLGISRRQAQRRASALVEEGLMEVRSAAGSKLQEYRVKER